MAKIVAIGLAMGALIAVPATAPAALSPSDFKNASKFCKALKADMGESLFRQTYGTSRNHRNAHGKCVSKNARALDEVHASARSQCQTEQTADADAFAQKYGTGKHLKNAFRRCVSSKAKQLTADRHDEIVGAAKDCRDERAAGADAFRTKYGTNHNGRNSFGKCVSKHVQEDEQKS